MELKKLENRIFPEKHVFYEIKEKRKQCSKFNKETYV